MKAPILTIFLCMVTVTTVLGQPQSRVARTPKLNYDWRAGYVNITEIGGALGLATTTVPFSKSYFAVTTINGYQFSRNVKGGIGVGLQFHNGGMLIPLFIDGRFNFSAQDVVPFFGIAGGVAMSAEDFNGQSRIFFNPTAGVKYVAMSKVSFNLSAGLMVQAGGAEKRSSFLNLKLGVEFKGKPLKNL